MLMNSNTISCHVQMQIAYMGCTDHHIMWNSQLWHSQHACQVWHQVTFISPSPTRKQAT